MLNKNYFYDIHYHAFDLSHVNLSAFLKKILNDKDKSIDSLLNEKLKWWIKLILPFIPNKIISKKIISSLEGKINNIQNTLSVYEQPIEDHFLIVEYFLKQKHNDISPIIKDNTIQIGGKSYDKLIICPLIMDFGQKSSVLNKDVFYNLMPGKPIVKQVIDLFNAIKNYYSYELVLNNETQKLEKVKVDNPENKPLRILPFLGINPANYQPFEQKVVPIFEQYFKDYQNDNSITRFDRIEKSIKAFIDFDGKLKDGQDKNITRTNMFFGVKVYPPLGFEPDHEDSIKLFQECIKYNLPVTTHCSDGGFKVDDNSEYNTNPFKAWNVVFSTIVNEKPELRKLKLNFAHFGVQKNEKTEWRKAILNLAQVFPNIYTDISSLAHVKDSIQEENFYEEMEKWLNNNTINQFNLAKERVLFGSDFSINLMETDSYNSYLNNIHNCNLSWMKNITNDNPEKFLFGDVK